jgi:MFS family permease
MKKERGTQDKEARNEAGRRRQALGLLALAEWLSMTVWFSASAVVPALAREWSLGPSAQSWLTMAVQLGFVAGALGSALLNLADLLPSPRLFAASSFLAALATALIPAAGIGYGGAVALRFLTGLFLAGVYPVGMKIMAGWTREDRGFGIGLLVGALTVGSASPHLANALGGVGDWRFVLYVAAGLAAAGGLLAVAFIKEGPYRAPSPSFNWKYAASLWKDRGLALVNLGYLGHMWELYAMWTWAPVLLLAAFSNAGLGPRLSSLASFAVISAGGAGSLVAGRLADRLGRERVISASLAVSGACCLLVGALYGRSPALLFPVCLVWGFAVVADSAQFSARASELCPPERTGTALTLQTSLGFLLTLATIRLVPFLERLLTWRWAFAVLALGPAFGLWAMARLMAGSRRHVTFFGRKIY